MSHPQAGGEPEGLAMQRLSKVLSDPMRVRILAECSIEAMSPRSFQDSFGAASLADVLQGFEVLEQFGWLGRVSPEADASPEALDCLYIATEPLIFGTDWSGIPDSAKDLVLQRIVESLYTRVNDAMAAGTMIRRPDSHLTWTPLALDQQGWDTMIARVDALFYSLFEEQEKANSRMVESGEAAIPMTVALLAFESPKHAP